MARERVKPEDAATYLIADFVGWAERERILTALAARNLLLALHRYDPATGEEASR